MRATIAFSDLTRIRYINYSYWNVLSEGSRSPLIGGRRFAAGERPFGETSEAPLTIAEAMRRGTDIPPVILVAPARDGPFVILEGHCRMTAWAIVGAECRATLEGLVGISAGVRGWSLF
jgi:hypothetical protein